MAMVALIFAEYFDQSISPEVDVSTWISKATAILGIALITGLNCMGTRMGVDSANVFMVIKLIGLGSIAVIGLAFGINHGDAAYGSDQVSPRINPTQPPQVFEQGLSLIWTGSKHLVDALFAALFAYGGWESVRCSVTRFLTQADGQQISFVVGEMAESSRNLPRVLNNAIGIVVSLSILANIAFYIVLSPEVLRSTNAVALVSRSSRTEQF